MSIVNTQPNESHVVYFQFLEFIKHLVFESFKFGAQVYDVRSRAVVVLHPLHRFPKLFFRRLLFREGV